MADSSGNNAPLSSRFLDRRDRKRKVAALADSQLAALQRFHYGDDLTALAQGQVAVKGFALNPVDQVPEEWHLSISSTATCVRSMLASPIVGDRADYTLIVSGLEKRFTEEKLMTRGLEHGNAYTVGQLLPTIRRIVNGDQRPEFVRFCIERLRDAVREAGVSLGNFPPNGYLTYWSLVGLDSWDEFDAGVAKSSLDWSEAQLYRQLALFTAADDEADAYQLGYTLLIQRRFRRTELKDSVVEAALAALFDAQLPGGLWEKKEPLFTYGEHGDAYPFAFELLNAVLREFVDAPRFLAPHEESLERATAWAERNAYGGPTPLWRSGHLVDEAEPESWATAEVYYFLQNYRTYLAEQILAGALRESGRGRAAKPPIPLAFAQLYQPAVTLPGGGGPPLLGDLLVERMLEQLRIPGGRSDYSLSRHPRRRRLPRSGIFFGPPGTGKTTYASSVAEYLGWPLLTITPADFAAEGLLLIPTVGRRLFDRLLELEDTVVFFDEMEELMRRRAGGPGDFEQRFLTPSFLPALQDLRDRAACIYLVATNNFEDLDEAARAPRRFDFQVQVRPPAFDEKLRLLQRDYAAVDTEDIRNVLKGIREKVEWATLREINAFFRVLQSDSSKAAALAGTFEPTLYPRRGELDEEAKYNSFETAA